MLRDRDLPRRAVVLHPTTIQKSDIQTSEWSEMLALWDYGGEQRKIAAEWQKALLRKIKSGIPRGKSKTVYLDLPESPGFTELVQHTFMKLPHGQDVVPFDKIFPITSTMSTYAQQFKYRCYVFGAKDNLYEVAAATYKAMKERGIYLNAGAFSYAKLNPLQVAELVGEAIPPVALPLDC